jgi:nucleoside-diphosphate-sugar epimerase
VAEQVPAWRDSAQRLGFVNIRQIINSLLWTIENPPSAVRVMNVPDIRPGKIAESL